MSQTLKEIAEQLHRSSKKVQLIYAFNGTGKTRLSREFIELVSPENTEDTDDREKPSIGKILYYNAFTEDLFYWDNDSSILVIQPNVFTTLILRDLGQDQNVITHFQRYTDEKLNPVFDHTPIEPNDRDDSYSAEPFTGVKFSYQRGNEEPSGNIKISKGEESNFIWSIFYSIIEEAVSVLNEPEPENRETRKFDDIEYIFIDDPVSSLDDNHLIHLAVDIASLIKSAASDLKFIITTHNPLFYNVLTNEFNNDRGEPHWKRNTIQKHRLEKHEDGTHKLVVQPTDSPFSYHLFLKKEIERALEIGEVHKYHFAFLRNILEKTSTFLGYNDWRLLLPTTDDGRPNPYQARIINFASHSKHSADEVTQLEEDDIRVLRYLLKNVLNQTYQFKTDST